MNLVAQKKKQVLKDRFFFVLSFCLRSLIPIVAFLLIVVFDLPTLAYVVVLLAKWQVIFARPRFWLTNLRVSAADLVVGLSIVYAMTWPDLSLTGQLMWLGVYLIWVWFIKTLKTQNGFFIRGVAIQSFGVSVLVYNLSFVDSPLVLLGIWLISLIAVQHLLTGLQKEPYHDYFMHLWGVFAVQLAWVLLHWQINFWIMPRLAFIQTVILIALTILYVLHRRNRLEVFLKRQVLISTLIIVVFVLLLSSVHAVSI